MDLTWPTLLTIYTKCSEGSHQGSMKGWARYHPGEPSSPPLKWDTSPDFEPRSQATDQWLGKLAGPWQPHHKPHGLQAVVHPRSSKQIPHSQPWAAWPKSHSWGTPINNLQHQAPLCSWFLIRIALLKWTTCLTATTKPAVQKPVH